MSNKNQGKLIYRFRTCKKAAAEYYFNMLSTENTDPDLFNNSLHVGVFFRDLDAESYPLSTPEYDRAYAELAEEIAHFNAQFFIVRHQNSYVGNGIFTHGYTLKDGSWVRTKKVRIDKLYDKGGFVSDDNMRVINHEYIDEICANKMKTYALFSGHCPQTLLVQNETEFEHFLPQITTDRKVIKPLSGEGGHGVKIGTSAELTTAQKRYPLLLQAFMDTSGGVPGTAINGIHDLRVVVLGGEIIMAFVRTPQAGRLQANVAQGGAIHFLDLGQIPDSAVAVVKRVDEQFSNYPNRLYGIDIGFTPEGAQIIELNSRIALWEQARGPEMVYFHKKLAHFLVHF